MLQGFHKPAFLLKLLFGEVPKHPNMRGTRKKLCFFPLFSQSERLLMHISFLPSLAPSF